MSTAAYPGPFTPDDPARRLPWVLAIAVLLVMLALLGLGRMLQPPVPARRPAKAEPLQARIYELPASRGSAFTRREPGGRQMSRVRPSHSRVQAQHAPDTRSVTIPRVATSAAAALTLPHHPRQTRRTPITQATRPDRSAAFNWATLQSQINTAVSQSESSLPHIHDPHTLVARYYLASILEKLQRVGDMNDPTSLTGMPVVRLVIGRHGELQQLSLLRTSGDDRLDQAALQIARESAPFAPFPDKLQRQTQHIAVVCYMKFVGYRQLYTDY